MEANKTATPLDADAVRALMAAKYPNAMNSPLAQLFSAVAAKDEAERACDFANLQAVASIAAEKRDAFDYALTCIETCKAHGFDFDEETLSHNVESNFPDLSIDDCEEIARSALSRATATTNASTDHNDLCSSNWKSANGACNCDLSRATGA